MVLLALDRTPGTIERVAASLAIPKQVASSTVARLMQFGLIEVRLSPAPVLTTSAAEFDFLSREPEQKAQAFSNNQPRFPHLYPHPPPPHTPPPP